MITTKKGDEGQSYFLGRVVDKDSLLLEAVGSVDELQSILELIDQNPPLRIHRRTSLEKGGLINDLGKIMGELVCGIKFEKYDLRVEQMEKEIEKNNLNIDKFVKFKSKKARELNWARTVCRRAERRIVSLSKKQKINKSVLKYFNRLSDYLFMKAVKEN